MWALILIALVSEARAEISKVPLFVIQRSLNRNEVNYDLRTKDSKIDLDCPLDDYWLMHARSGKREELTGFERTRAYGYELRKVNAESFTFVLVSMPQREIDVKIVDGKYVATLPIQKRPAQLTTVFIQLARGGLIPSIAWIEVRGKDLENQQFIYERLIP